VGSVKSNIGHTLAAAGAAGALKAMLALEQREIPPTINFEKANEHLALKGTPFYINSELREWKTPAGQARRAAVSSFGFSGTNAHVVLEEYTAADRGRPAIEPGKSFVLPLSARTSEQLSDYAKSLARFVAAYPELDLAALCRTFQSGRTVFSERGAIAFHNREELLRALGGEMPRSGETVDSNALNPKGRHIHAPGYPFARERYWVSAPAPHQPKVFEDTVRPILGRNLSASGDLRFTRRLDGGESFLSSHRDGADRLLLGLFYPDMAREAAEAAMQQSVRGLKNLVWGKPVRINGRPRDLSVVLSPDEDGLLYHVCADGEEAAPCHVGELILDDPQEFWPGKLDVDRARDLLAGRDLYRENGEILAWIDGSASARGMHIHPERLGAIWKLLGHENGNGPRFPYTLRSVIHDGPLAARSLARVWTRRTANGGGGTTTIALFDPDGVPRLALDGLVTAGPNELPEISLDEGPVE
jgi:hypothetical protein